MRLNPCVYKTQHDPKRKRSNSSLPFSRSRTPDGSLLLTLTLVERRLPKLEITTINCFKLANSYTKKRRWTTILSPFFCQRRLRNVRRLFLCIILVEQSAREWCTITVVIGAHCAKYLFWKQRVNQIGVRIFRKWPFDGGFRPR